LPAEDSPAEPLPPFRILAPTAILGYGFPLDSFARGMDCRPDLIAVDAGSADPGPWYLGSGKSFTDRAAVKRDLGVMLGAAVRQGIPLIIGTAGGSGAAPHLDWTTDIVKEVAAEQSLSFRLGTIAADIPQQVVHEALARGHIEALQGAPALHSESVETSNTIVAQMGVEPVQHALQQGCQVIVAGRAYDPAVFAALPMLQGYDAGLCLHLGKILECAAIAASPGSGADCALGILEKDRFVLQPLDDRRVFTPTSVAAHTLYEKSDPRLLPGPGGELDLSEVNFKDIGDGRVAVSGSRFVPSRPYRVKLEGTRLCGYRSVCVAGVRDPIMIRDIDSILQQVRAQVRAMLDTGAGSADVHCHLYGRNGVMGEREPQRAQPSHELGIVIEAVAASAEQADTLCSLTRSTLMHYGYEGRIATAGNLAFPFSPSDMRAGAVYEFSLYHLMQADPLALFPLSVEDL
tara:strand:+ start:99708 stop:101090 length:1383 start_codon:yes stop_codon:yes gene_type:complete